MGMLVEITVATDRPDGAREACRTAFARLLELNRVFSDYDPESELSALCRRAGQGPVPVSAELYAVLARAQTLARESGGAFDVTAGPVIRLWREARRTGVPPAVNALAAASYVPSNGWPALGAALAGARDGDASGLLRIVDGGWSDDGFTSGYFAILALDAPAARDETTDGFRAFLRAELPPQARNALAEQCRGDVVAFLDDDCYVTQGWLARLRAVGAEGILEYALRKIVP